VLYVYSVALRHVVGAKSVSVEKAAAFGTIRGYDVLLWLCGIEEDDPYAMSNGALITGNHRCLSLLSQFKATFLTVHNRAAFPWC
jgi:hypothetical protein